MMLSLQDLLLVPLELAVAVQWEVPVHISQTVVDRAPLSSTPSKAKVAIKLANDKVFTERKDARYSVSTSTDVSNLFLATEMLEELLDGIMVVGDGFIRYELIILIMPEIGFKLLERSASSSRRLASCSLLIFNTALICILYSWRNVDISARV
eukprot:scaffold1203_cov228-Chaetoceros_neogracile.AAC.3